MASNRTIRYKHPTEDRELTEKEYQKLTLLATLSPKELENVKKLIENKKDSNA